ncbi:MAG: hypothetical protein ABSA97_00055 [Verrucomicrobiia bacterium]
MPPRVAGSANDYRKKIWDAIPETLASGQRLTLTYRASQIRILNRARLQRIAAGDERI